MRLYTLYIAGTQQEFTLWQKEHCPAVIIWSGSLTCNMRSYHSCDKDACENSIKNNLDKALYILSGTG